MLLFSLLLLHCLLLEDPCLVQFLRLLLPADNLILVGREVLRLQLRDLFLTDFEQVDNVNELVVV